MEPERSAKIVVVGASAAGLRAACRARRLLPGASVIVVDRDTDISTGACGLPYYLSGDIDAGEALRKTPYDLVRDVDFFRNAKGIKVLAGWEFLSVDRQAKTIQCRSVDGGQEAEIAYETLVLATGARPSAPSCVPAPSERIHYFKTLADAAILRKSLETGRTGSVVIIGGGFIGCELTEAFGAMWGAEVTLVEAEETLLPGLLDPEMARLVRDALEGEDVTVAVGLGVDAVEEGESSVVVKAGGTVYEADRVIVAAGVRPNVEAASAAGISLGSTGAIAVDEHMRTSDPDVFAAGDCVESRHGMTGKPVYLPLGSLANRQGRVIGSNLGGIAESFPPVYGSAALKIFDWNVAVTGLTEQAAVAAGFDVGRTWGTFTDLADYYPGSQNIHLKIVYEISTGRLLGMQALGKGEVVKRVDVFAALLRRGGILEDLLDAEFAYAPPYAPALDPLCALACAARNDLQAAIRPLSPDAGFDDRVVVDVRQPVEVKQEPLTAAERIHVPFPELRDRWRELPSGRSLLLVCHRGLRSAECVRILGEMGIEGTAYLGGGLAMRPRD